ncbi:MAG: endonuclease/exonuclease/phosphatase family protein [Planctomycetota bacterium]
MANPVTADIVFVEPPVTQADDQSASTPTRLGGAIRSRLVTLTWLGVAGLLVALAAAASGPRWWLLDLASHFQWHYLVASVVLLALAVVLRRRMAAVLAAVALVVTAARVVPWYVGGAATGDGAAVRILIVNVLKSNGDAACVLEYIEERDPDVLILQEVDDGWMRHLAPLRATLPHSVEALRPDDFGIALLSRLAPARGGEVVTLGTAGLPSLACTFERDGSAFTLIATHPLPPVRELNARLRDEQIADLASLLEVGASRGETYVVAGDLNASMWSTPYRDLIERSGLRNAREGFGVLGTWAPRGRGWLGRVPIDHCLHSPDIAVARCATGPSIGSDHLPLEVDLVLPSPARALAQ